MTKTTTKILATKPSNTQGLPSLHAFVVFAVSLYLLVSFSFAAEVTESPITDADRDHWSFRPLRPVPVPTSQRSDWGHHFIDQFILTNLEAKGLSPAPTADRRTLLRRMSFDVIGLPPTTAEIEAFECDSAPGAADRLVDRLLASPTYGERWGQHWLDLARFAETDGFEHDKKRDNAWKYRDWVIAALNADMPYDQFVRRQLAGDVGVKPADPIATMFCLAGPDMPDINDQDLRRHQRLNELTATVGSVFLGLQFGCAECHDHKYDPVSQLDFYRLRAVFESSVPKLKRDAPVLTLQEQAFDGPARLWLRGDHRRPGQEVQPDVPRIGALQPVKFTTEQHPRIVLADWLTHPSNPLSARVIVNRVWQHHFGRGLCATPSDVGVLNADPSHPELLDALANAFLASGQSLKQLHRWILTSSTYQQSSRSMPGDSMWARRRELDPDNECYSRFPRQRLDGESIRNAMLTAAGRLHDATGGPGVMPPLPTELMGYLLKGQWTVSKDESDHYRRSIYLFARRNLRYPLFEAFDRPDANASCPQRNRSTIAPQALNQFNSELSLLTARHWAGRLLQESDVPRRIELMHQHAFGRRPTATEIESITQFVRSQQQLLSLETDPVRLATPIPMSATLDPPTAAGWVDACLALFNTAEFLYID